MSEPRILGCLRALDARFWRRSAPMSVKLSLPAEPQPHVPLPGRVDFHLLGPVEAVVDGETIALGGAKLRALLALLVLHANEIVSRDLLIDRLWGEHAPASAGHALVVYVSRLRKALKAHIAEDILQTEPAGYLLRVEAEQTDVWRFEHALEEGRRALAEGRPGEAADILRRGLAEWRGAALGDLAFEPFEAEARHLEELRLTALEERIDADLALGRHAELVGELESLVAKHPLNERLRGQLMLALYRSGRQVGALEVYRNTRRFLVDELGVEPGTDLQRLEQAILRHDPQLEAPAIESPRVAAAEPDSRPRPLRKTVSLLSAALTPPAKLRAQLDPEALDVAVDRHVTAVKQAIERHGGTIERFVGDTVLGIFGVPAVHEDDALRAVRAASDMRDAATSLNETLVREGTAALELRVGVTTGRVLAGAGPLVTGEPVNVAAELCRGADAGEILIGEETLRLVSRAVVVEPPEPGKPENARRLVSVAHGAGATPRRTEGRMVGRERQFALLRHVFADVVAERSCHLFTVTGTAGVGKTRLAAELAASLEGVTVVSGRCLAYGTGVTYHPVVDMLRQLPDFPGLPIDEVSREVIAALLGEAQAVTSPAEIECAVRKVLEAAARRQPLLVVLDDVQWGEAPFLDLVEHVADLSRDAPLLLVCLARPDLLERRPGWAGGMPNATNLRLEPLSPDETDELIGRLVGETDVEPAVLERVREAAQGNPLFLEEMLALVVEPGVHEPTVPPTIEAVLAARLDQLQPGERDVLEAGAVEGNVFHAGAVRALAAEDGDVATHLDSLVRKDLVRPGEPDVHGEEAFRFRHLLIRDAAYAAVPKARRAELHERFADWLEEHGADSVEAAAIGGHHLEQACRFRGELDPADERVAEVAARAGDRLAVAGRSAHALGDIAAAVNLLTRARALLPQHPDELALELADVLVWAGRLAEAAAMLGEVAHAPTRRDPSAELHVQLVRTSIDWFADPERTTPELLALAEEAIPAFEASGNERGLTDAWVAVAEYEHMHCRFDARNHAFEEALVHAQRAGDAHHAADILTRIGVGHVYGPTPVTQGLHWLASQARLLRHRPMLIATQAVLEAMRGHFQKARVLLGEADALNEELGAGGIAALQAESAWMIAMHAGDAAAAERASLQGCRLLEEMGGGGFLSVQAAELALALCALGRFDEASKWARKSRKLSASDDVYAQMLWRQGLANVAADQGELAEAETLARDAVALAAQTDMLAATGDALLTLAGVLRRAGRVQEARNVARQALGLYQRKGDTVMSGRARLLSEEIQPHAEPE